MGVVVAMALAKCDSFWGEANIFSEGPALRDVEGALFVPRVQMLFDDDLNYGIYDANGYRIVEAAYRRGPGPTYVGSSERSIYNPADFPWAPDENYIYGGIAYFHYGHFLLATFSRYWVDPADTPDAKWIYHFDAPSTHWTGVPFVQQINEAAGIPSSDVVWLQEPVRLPRLRIPAPAFEETLQAFAKYRTLGLRVGGNLVGQETASQSGRPVYITKQLLGNGVRKFVNEEIIADLFDQAGFEIVCPEALSLKQQIELFEQRPLIVGMLGSALHTSIFARRVCPILALNNSSDVQSNFTLIDGLVNADTTYVYPTDGVLGGDDSSTFLAKFLLRDTRETAAELLDLARRKLDGEILFA